MSELLPGVHLVDGVGEGTNVYLVKDSGPGWTLIDTGLPGASEATLAYLAKQKISPQSVGHILLTHLHKDHVGSLTETAAATGAKTYAHWLEAAFIACDPKYDGPGMPPEKPYLVSEKLKDGDPIDAAGGLVAMHTPGHTPGHTSYYHPGRKILFSGDLFFVDGKKLLLTTPNYTIHTPSAQVSARRVSELSVDSLMTYHGGPILKDGGREVVELVKKLR